MSNIGRNDPCPCGSGKKYKHCCGSAPVITPDFKYDRIRQYDGQSSHLLLKYARQRWGEDAVADAWDDFNFYEEIPFPGFSPDTALFERWFLFDWRPEQKETLAEIFLSERKEYLERSLARFIEATIRSPYSFYQILERGQIIFARVVELDGTYFLMGNGSLPLPPLYIHPIIELREDLVEENRLKDMRITTETLLKKEETLREVYFELEDELKNRKVSLKNTDGDALSLITLTYAIPSLDAAFQALKNLQQKVDHSPDDEMLSDAERNEAGEILKISLHWLKKSKEKGNTILGHLSIQPTILTIDINSERRSKRIQKEIIKRLGKDAVLLTTKIMPQEEIEKQIHQESSESKKESEHERILRESPEMRVHLKEMMEKHWATWPGIPLPALNGLTPRKAAQIPIGRELLNALLMEFEMHNKSEKDDYLKVDIAKLRKNLGLDKA